MTADLRRSRVAEIQRTRLGGPDRIVLDMLDNEPVARYAHIYENGGNPTLHTTNDPKRPDDVYALGAWRRVGVIDLDSGDAVHVA